MHIHFQKKKLLTYGGIGLFVILVFFVGSVELTSRPSFCPTCHYMEPFYKSWQESAHKTVTCTDCHFAPGLKNKVRGKMEGLVQVVKYISRSYLKSKPWAEIPDESCLRDGCHQERLLAGEEEFKNVHFDHKPHLTELRRGKKLRCTSCHSQIVQGSHMVVTETTCFICHFKHKGEDYEKTSKCRLCHTDARMLANSQKDEIRFDHTQVVHEKKECDQCHGQTVMGTGFVAKEQCYNCHWENERLARFEETDFIHKTHITEHKIECFHCHSMIEHKINHDDVEIASECKSCHVGTHSAQKKLLAGVGDAGVESIPNPMFEIGINCRGCHMLHGEGNVGENEEDTYVARAESCEHCHGEGFGNLMRQWEKSTDEKLTRIQTIFDDVQNRLIQAGKRKKTADLLSAAAFDIDLVRQGKSVHNMRYSDALLNAAFDKLSKSLKDSGIAYELPAFKDASTFIPSDCVSCHISVEVKDIVVFDLHFSHERHVIKHNTKCQECHSNLRRHGQLKLKRDDCLNCHHQKQKSKKCEDCHRDIYNMLAGKIRLINNPEPDPMFEAEVDCYSCHSGEKGKIVKPTRAVCIECHDEDETYGETYDDWRTEMRNLLMEIASLRSKVDETRLNNAQKETLKNIDWKVHTISKEGGAGAHNYDLLTASLAEVKAQLSTLH